MKSIPAANSLYQRFTSWLKEEFQPGVLYLSFTSGILLYILEIIFAISFAALIFSGPLTDQLPYGIGWIVLGDAILFGSVALMSSFRSMIAAQQDAPGALIAIATLTVMGSMPASASPTQRMATAIMMVAGTTLLTGLFFILLGIFKLDGLVRFLPYPVIGGFLAGTGWTLTTGGVNFMVNTSLGPELLQPGRLLQWLPGLLLGGAILVVTSRIKSPLTLPIMLVGATGLFYLIVWLTHTPLQYLQSEGWLLGVMPSGNLWQFPFRLDLLKQVNWAVIWQHFPILLPLPLISVIAMLLNTSGIELIAKKDISLSKELIRTGIGNILAGMAGGLTGYPTISFTALNHSLNKNNRLPGLIGALLIGLTAFTGMTFLIYIPKVILGGLLAYVGLAMLAEWVFQAWFKFPRIDFFIILTILGIVIVSGFMQAVAVGLVMTIVLFVINYSRVDIVKHTLTGTSYRSRVTRERVQQVILDAEGDQLYILKLQGFIFFGTANSLFEQVYERIHQTNLPKIRYALIDFSQVSGLDSTGLLSFTKLLEFTKDQQVILVLTGLRSRCADQFAKGGFNEKQGVLHIFSDIDHGAEWCEEQILFVAQVKAALAQTLPKQLEALWGNPEQVGKLVGYMQRREIAQGQYLIHQGDEPNLIFLIESGQMTAQVETMDKPPMRLETMRGGRAVGELGFYLGTRRTAAVVADEPSVVYAFSQSDLKGIEKNDPETAYVFHRLIVHLMGERMLHLIKAVNALQD